MTEVFPLEKYQEAYDRMLSAKVRFRAVLSTGM
jgi:D-arabinose 1-dehydrogenase-like Zn-dependent alcohol dehydrogenase